MTERSENMLHPEAVHAAAADAMGTGVTVTPVKAGLFNSSYVISDGMEEAVLRIAPPDDAPYLFYEKRMMRREPALHRLLREQTTLPVPQVLKADFTHTRIDRDYLVLEKMPGTMLRSPLEEDGRPAEPLLEQMGRMLRELHNVTSPVYGYPGSGMQLPPAGPWHTAFPAMWNALIDDINKTGGYTPDEAVRLCELCIRAEPLFVREAPASLCHMDFWHQNILANPDGTITGIIDWDRAVWGDPSMDFVKLDFCGLLQPALVRGYGTPSAVTDEDRMRMEFYLLYELQKYVFIHRVRRVDPDRERMFRGRIRSSAERLENILPG